MKLKPINGWAKARMLKRVERLVPVDGCRGPNMGRCYYDGRPHGLGQAGCGVGCFLPARLRARVDEKCDNFTASQLLALPGRLGDAVRRAVPLDSDSMQTLQSTHDGAQHGARDRVWAWIEANVADDEEGGAA